MTIRDVLREAFHPRDLTGALLSFLLVLSLAWLASAAVELADAALSFAGAR